MRVRMQRCSVELLARGVLNDLAKVHHNHTVADVFDHREIMRDEQVGQIELALQLGEQIYYLGLNRNIECRDRFIQH